MQNGMYVSEYWKSSREQMINTQSQLIVCSPSVRRFLVFLKSYLKSIISSLIV